MANDSGPLFHDLVDRFRRGDAAAFEKLTGRYRERLLSVIRLRFGSRLGQRVDPEDVLQETLLRVYQGRESFKWEGRSRFIAWLATIAENTTTDVIRRHLLRERNSVKKEVSLSPPIERNSAGARLEDVVPASATGPLRKLRRGERLARLEKALEQLSDDHREVIVLSILECLPTREVGERMGLSSGAVCMLRARALRQLRSLFGDTESLRLSPYLRPTADERPEAP